MPELPEVERARKLIQDTCKGYRIKTVSTVEDKLVFGGGITHDEFAKEVEGRTVTGCERKGKTFWMTLSGKGRLPVMHFGMNGMIQLKGQEPFWYVRKPKERTKQWPPKYHKFVMELEPQEGSVGDQPLELAFMDSRRFARIRLIPSPVEDHPPVSKLGFDPVLSYPTSEEFRKLLGKKKGTIKGVIMDQAFSAGVGNWVADEILYQARIHPACPVPDLTDTQIEELHRQIKIVPTTAVDVNADSKKFPEDWIFRWRWSKGRKHENGSKKAKDVDSAEEEELAELKPKNKAFLALPDGKPATIDFIEVGGRTTAVVKELQKMPDGVEIKPKISKGGKGVKSKKGKRGDDDDESSPESEGSEEETKPAVTTPRQKAAMAAKVVASSKKPRSSRVKAESDAAEEDTSKGTPAKSPKRKAAITDKNIKEEQAKAPAKKARKSSTSTSTPQGARTSNRRKSGVGKR